MTDINKTKYQTGSITFGLPILLSIIGIVGVGFGTFYTSLGKASGERSEIRTEVAVERTRNDNMEKLLEKMDGKLDTLIGYKQEKDY